MTHRCPIANCPFPVKGPLTICKEHYRLIPRPQQDALNHYARTRKGGPAHEASFDRAVETITKLLAARATNREAAQKPAALPYRDD